MVAIAMLAALCSILYVQICDRITSSNRLRIVSVSSLIQAINTSSREVWWTLKSSTFSVGSSFSVNITCNNNDNDDEEEEAEEVDDDIENQKLEIVH